MLFQNISFQLEMDVEPAIKPPSPKSNCNEQKRGNDKIKDSIKEGTTISTNSSGYDDDVEVTNAELGLSEDHFSMPEGHFGLSTTEELEMAIENCKEMILDAPENTEKRKSLVKKLIQLRLKLQEIGEGPEEIPSDLKVSLGHHFVKKDGRSHRYCEKCAGVIWGMLQSWFHCEDCGFCCHSRCLSQITRTCAKVKVDENPNYMLSICPEDGLSAQNYKCAECRTLLIYTVNSIEPRQCDYNGLYYCPSCHWNDQAVIPARVLLNWDFELRRVCRASKQFLKLVRTRAVLRVQDINPSLFSFVEDLNLVKKLREEILIMKQYFLVCKAAKESKLLLQLQDKQHFVDNCDMYSLQDLEDVHSGQLIEYLTAVHALFAKHIKEDCEVCHCKGYICEICRAVEVIFSFDSDAAVCPNCGTVFHSECFIKKDRQCPKCSRLQAKAHTSQEQPS